MIMCVFLFACFLFFLFAAFFNGLQQKYPPKKQQQQQQTTTEKQQQRQQQKTGKRLKHAFCPYVFAALQSICENTNTHE